MKESFTPLDKPTTELEFPDWSGTKERPRVGWETMHRLSEELLRNPWHQPQPRPEAINWPEFDY